MRHTILHDIVGEKICCKCIGFEQSPRSQNETANQIYYVYLLQGQADDNFSSKQNQQATYAYAAVIVAVWQLFPHFGKLFLALLYQSCPYLVPYFIPQFSEQNTDDYSR